MWPDNRIARDAHYLYRYDRHGRLTEKTDLIPEGVIRTDDERTHRYHYDSQHRLVHYTLSLIHISDGSVTQSQFDAVGRLKAQTDAAGRTTEYSPDVVTGLITRITTPDGRA